MAARRSPKSSKSKSKKKIKRPSAASRGAARGRSGAKSKPKPRPKSRASSKPRAKTKARARAKSRPKPKPRAAAKPIVRVKSVPAARLAAKARAGAIARPRAAYGRGEPQTMLDLDEGPAVTELPRDSDIALPPVPKKRRSKGQQLNMLDYPGESLTVGMPAPEFSLPSTLGGRVTLSEFRGKRVILYFYPKDDTPGCTMEACAFRDHLPRIEAKDAVVLGISLDDELSHERFAQKYNLPFALLSDKDAAVSRQYGTYKEKNLYGRSFWGIERTTFVINREGKVEHVFRRVKVEGHAEEVMATLAV